MKTFLITALIAIALLVSLVGIVLWSAGRIYKAQGDSFDERTLKD